MGWLTEAPDWVIDSEVDRGERYIAGKKRRMTYTVKHAEAMTYETAKDLVDSTKTDDPSADLVLERQNEAGAYLVRCSSIVYTDWEDE
jgi:hypothetical protein